MGIYIILLILLIIIGDILKQNKNLKNKKIYIIISFILLGVISAIRSSSVGADTQQFVNAFMKIEKLTLPNAINTMGYRYEEGFIILCKTLSLITSNPQILIIFTSIFINGAVCIFIYRESKDVVLSIVLYILLNYYFSYMNIMRQALAICIILLGYTYFLKKDKKILFVLSVLLACGFHTTSLLVLAIIFIKDIKYETVHYIATLIVAVLGFLVAPQLFQLASKFLNSYSEYVNSEFYESNYFAAVFIFLVNLTMLTVSFLSNRRKNVGLSQLLIMSSITVIVSAIGIRITLIERMANYFNIYNIVLLPNAIANNSKKITRKLIYVSVLAFGIAYFLIIMRFRPEWYMVLPYTTFWGG